MASSPGPKLVVVDDTDSRIQYSNSNPSGEDWFSDIGSEDKFGNFGPPYLRTLHGTKTNTSLTFGFNGTNVQVFGLTQVRKVDGVLDPSWECYIDGISTGASTANQNLPGDENNWVLCPPSAPFGNGPHIITVNITSRGSTFWFDDIKYQPSPNAPLYNDTVLIDNSDPSIEFIGWKSLGGSANMTQQEGARMAFNFTGKSLSWYAFIPTELPHNSTTASYSIDGGPSNQFPLNGLPADAKNTVYNQVFFTTPDLTPGPHSLVVTHEGNGSFTPLCLDYLLVTNASAPATSSTSTVSSAPTSSSSGSSSSQGGQHPNIGAIVGAVIGALALIIVGVILAIFFRRKRRRRVVKPMTVSNILGDPDRQVRPFNLSGDDSVPVSFPVTPRRQPEPYNVGYDFHRISNPKSSGHVANASNGDSSDMRSSNMRYSSSQSGAGANERGPNTAPSSAGQYHSSNPSSSRVVMHQDSGLRIPREDDTIIEVPPNYTEA